MQTEMGALAELVKTVGPSGAVIAYLLYRDLVQPLRNKRNGKSNSNGRVIYASESDVNQLASSFRDHRTKAEENFTEIRERLVRVETLLETDGHQHGGTRS